MYSTEVRANIPQGINFTEAMESKISHDLHQPMNPPSSEYYYVHSKVIPPKEDYPADLQYFVNLFFLLSHSLADKCLM
jgi:hypothetical protein